MLDFIKLFFSNLHLLPPWLKNMFALMFLTTAFLWAASFKRWLEARKTNPQTDMWSNVPVTPALVQACLWAVWASASLYTVCLDDAKIAAPGAVPSPAPSAAVAAAPAPVAAAAAVATRAHTPRPAAQPRAGLPEPDAARAPRAEVGGAVVTGHAPATERRAHPRNHAPRGPEVAGAEAASGADTGGTTASTPHIGTTADSTAPVAPAAASHVPGEEPAAEGAPHGKLARRLKAKKGGHAQAAVTPGTEPAAAPEPQVAPAKPAAAPAPMQQSAVPAPAGSAAPAEGGPRFIVERPGQPPTPSAH